MSTENEEIVVKIEDDTSGDQTQQKTEKATAADPVAELAKQVKDLEGKADRERAGREEALRAADAARRDADQARKEAESAKGEAVDDRMAGITAGLDAAEAEASAAETEYKTAMEAGDFGAAAKAQRKMAGAEAKALRLTEAKDDLEATRREKPEPRTEQRTQQEQRPPADPVEAYIRGRTEPTANWLRQHTDYITDHRKNAKLTAAHWDAVGDGLAPDTPEYFERVETFIGLRKADDGQQQTQQTTRPRRASVAPVTTSGGGTSGGGNEVRLSRGEAAAATDGTHVWNYDDPSGQKRFKKGDPIGVQEFARRKQEMQKQGLYDKALLEA